MTDLNHLDLISQLTPAAQDFEHEANMLLTFADELELHLPGIDASALRNIHVGLQALVFDIKVLIMQNTLAVERRANAEAA